MTELILLLALVGAIFCCVDLRLGMYLMLLVGFAQDPLRKLILDGPVYLSALVVMAAVFTFFGAVQSGGLRHFAAMPGWDSHLKVPILAFVAMVSIQSIATFVYTGNLVLAGIGLLVYLAPFPALLLGYGLASNPARVYTFLWVYVVLSAVVVSGTYLSWLGLDWDILQSVGEPLVVYSLETGEPLELPSGFLRAPEIAAWHAASGACIVLILGFVKGRKNFGVVSVALALFFVGAVVLTGRRKFLLEIFIFFPILWLLLLRFRIAAGRILYLFFALAVASVVVMATGVAESDTREAFEAPVVRGRDRTDEIFERIENLTFGAVPHIVDANGLFGSGAGSGSGGAQYFGGGEDRVGLAAEGGLGKVLAEIGIPGLLVFFWLGFRLILHMWRTLGAASRGAPEAARLTMGIAAFLMSNAVVFIGAHQAYSDPFVLLMIGSCLGFVLASHRFVGLPDRGRVPGHRPVHGGMPYRPGSLS